MTDYVLRAADAATMLAAYQGVGIATEDGIRPSGLFPDGTSWALLDWGPTATDAGHLSVLRWNGTAPTPPVPPSIEIIWTSATHAIEAYPAGLPRFA